jgi:hypothetical protein
VIYARKFAQQYFLKHVTCDFTNDDKVFKKWEHESIDWDKDHEQFHFIITINNIHEKISPFQVGVQGIF